MDTAMFLRRQSLHEELPFACHSSLDDRFSLYPRVFGDGSSPRFGGESATLSEAAAYIRRYDGMGQFRLGFQSLPKGFTLRVTTDGWVVLEVGIPDEENGILWLFNTGRTYAAEVVISDQRPGVNATLLWWPYSGGLYLRQFTTVDEQIAQPTTVINGGPLDPEPEEATQ